MAPPLPFRYVPYQSIVDSRLPTATIAPKMIHDFRLEADVRAGARAAHRRDNPLDLEAEGTRGTSVAGVEPSSEPSFHCLRFDMDHSRAPAGAIPSTGPE